MPEWKSLISPLEALGKLDIPTYKCIKAHSNMQAKATQADVVISANIAVIL